MMLRFTLTAWLLLVGLCFLLSQSEDVPRYEIVALDVVGCQSTDPLSLRAMSGLQVGQKIMLPGPATHLAIRKLLRQGLFTNVEVVQTRVEYDLVWLEIRVEEAPLLAEWKIKGGKAKRREEWLKRLEALYPAGTRWTVATEQEVRNWIENQLVADGHLFDNYTLSIHTDSLAHSNTVAIHLGQVDKPVLGEVTFGGDVLYAPHQLRKAMGIPKVRFKKIRPQAEFLTQARQQLLTRYQQDGYADAQIVQDSLQQEDGKWHWYLEIAAGQRYYFGNINWHGNTRYETSVLAQVLGIETGEPFDRERLERSLHFNPEGGDVSGLYMDHGHLFFQAQPVETALRGDTIDVEIRMLEGPMAVISAVHIEGNDRTHEAVIKRELHTHPGQIFSRQAIIRSQRALLALGYFNPQTLDVKTEVDQQAGEVALTYVVKEIRNDQLEMSASFVPGSEDFSGSLVGTLGFSLNNFSLGGLLSGGLKNALGGGQRLSIRAQSSGLSYQSYNLSFTEPWLRGKPRPLSVGIFHQRFTDRDSLDQLETLSVTGASIGLGQRLPWGFGGWVVHGELGYQHIQLDRLMDIELDDGNVLNSGQFNNLYLKLKLNYQDLDDPFFPQRGSRLEVSGQWTPPFMSRTINSETPAANYRWLGYHKYRLTAEHYLPLVKNLVLKGSLKMGALAGYDAALGAPPFERFELGGNGNAGSQQANFVGNDILSLRGYERSDIPATANGGAVGFTKATVELRYQVVNQGALRGYLIGFAEGGNAWDKLRDFNPLDLQRSVGLGVRVQVPMIGTLGFDYGLGLDKDGFNFGDWRNYGQFNLIFGFEPE